MKKTHFIIVLGWIGTFILFGAYALNALGVIPSTGLIYSISNLIAAVLLGLRVAVDRNWSNVLLEIFFGSIAIISLIKYFFF